MKYRTKCARQYRGKKKEKRGKKRNAVRLRRGARESVRNEGGKNEWKKGFT